MRNERKILAVQQSSADQYLKQLQREQREHGRTMRKVGRYDQSPEELSKLLGVPF